MKGSSVIVLVSLGCKGCEDEKGNGGSVTALRPTEKPLVAAKGFDLPGLLQSEKPKLPAAFPRKVLYDRRIPTRLFALNKQIDVNNNPSARNTKSNKRKQNKRIHAEAQVGLTTGLLVRWQ